MPPAFVMASQCCRTNFAAGQSCGCKPGGSAGQCLNVKDPRCPIHCGCAQHGHQGGSL